MLNEKKKQFQIHNIFVFIIAFLTLKKIFNDFESEMENRNGKYTVDTVTSNFIPFSKNNLSTVYCNSKYRIDRIRA